MATVIIDTSVWVQAFRVPNSPEREEVERLIRDGNAVMVGVVYAELVRGARDQNEFEALESRLAAVPFAETSKKTWQNVGRLLFDLRRQGLTVALPDAVIAALALEGDHHVYTLDEHFQRVPGLRLYEAKAR